MSISNYLENKILDAVLRNVSLAVTTAYVSLHTADPGETGANEATGGSYARQSVAFDAAASGATANTSAINFTGMPSATIMAVGVWDAATVGNCLWTGWLGGTVDFFTGLASSDVLTSYGHGLVDDDRVVFEARDGAGLPGGITPGTIYFVRDAATDTFKIATTSGGSAIDLTTSGEGAVILVVPKVVNSGDTFQIPAGDLDIAVD